MEYLLKYPELFKLYNSQHADTQKKIILKINQTPSESDHEGFVYGFTKPEDKNTRNSFFMKLGRTDRNPDIRIKEWSGKQVFTIKSIYNKKFERLVHLFFKSHNVKRENKNKPASEEIEWFKFEKEHCINKHYIISRVNDINSLIDDLYLEDEYFDNSHSINIKSRITTLPIENNSSETNLPVENNSSETNIKSSVKHSINDCSKEYLMKIKGIGEKLSKKIIENRPYKTLDEIKKLSGIGNAKFNLIMEFCQL
jgi:DNA uptake protein ComE-like DNA-binding protein